MQIVTRVVAAVHSLSGTIAEEVGQQSQLIVRQRVFTAASLAKTLVWGFLHNPRASREELGEVAATCGALVSPQAIRVLPVADSIEQQRVSDRRPIARPVRLAVRKRARRSAVEPERLA